MNFGFAARQRLLPYRAYLYLIMWVEAIPRRYNQRQRDRLVHRVFQPLEAIFSDGKP